MRKIKFRGKLTTSNVFMYAVSLRRYDWIYGGIHFAYDCAYIHSCEHFNKGFSVIPETVGQFTGLTDCKYPIKNVKISSIKKPNK